MPDGKSTRASPAERPEQNKASLKDAGPRGSVDGPVLDSAALFGGHNQMVIVHNGQRYVLRITRHGKLILNK